MKKFMALCLGFALLAMSAAPAAFAGGRHQFGPRHNHDFSRGHDYRNGGLIGLGVLGLFGTYYGFRYIEPRVCEYVPAGPPIWNPTWQRWEPSSWVLVCR